MYEVHCRQVYVLSECWPALAMVVEEIHVEDIILFELVSLVLFLSTPWTFRILAHEEDQYTDFFCLLHSNKLNQGLGVRELLFELFRMGLF